MGKIRIFTDTNADLSRDIREELGIECLKMCTVQDGVVTPADSDFEAWGSCHDYYELLRAGKRITTTQVPAEEFRNAFTAAAQAGDTVIYIANALPLSSSVNTAAVVARDLLGTHPNAKIYCIDSKNTCWGEGMLVMMAAQMRNEGKSAEEIVAAVEQKRGSVNQFVTVGSLDMLKRAGRVKGSAAFFGNLLGVKPIIVSDMDGQNVPILKVKGRNASLDKLVELMGECVISPETQTVYISHADCPEAAEYLKQKALSLGFADARIGCIGAVVGACIGPDAVGIWCFGKEVTVKA